MKTGSPQGIPRGRVRSASRRTEARCENASGTARSCRRCVASKGRACSRRTIPMCRPRDVRRSPGEGGARARAGLTKWLGPIHHLSAAWKKVGKSCAASRVIRSSFGGGPPAVASAAPPQTASWMRSAGCIFTNMSGASVSAAVTARSQSKPCSAASSTAAARTARRRPFARQAERSRRNRLPAASAASQ